MSDSKKEYEVNEYEVDIVRRLRVRVNAKGPSGAITIASEDYPLAQYEVTNIQVTKITPNFSSDPNDE